MSKLYGTLQGCSNQEVTRRGHRHVSAEVKNWEFAVRATIVYKGGTDKDEIRVVLANKSTGEMFVLTHGIIRDVIDSLRETEAVEVGSDRDPMTGAEYGTLT